MSVLIIGAGVAGLAVAHELAARGVTDIRVIDAGPERHLGGKCRSQYWTERGRQFAGEHGYRFFPGFYRHVPELMARIPIDAASADPKAALHPFEDSVAGRLRPARAMGVCFPNRPMQVVPLGPPADLAGAYETLKAGLGLFASMRARDLARLVKGMHLFLTMCEARREGEIENLSLWDYLRADKLSEESQKILRVVPRGLVGMDAQQGSARTFLNTLFLMTTEWTTNPTPHRVLDGPTSERWLTPWRAWLERLGVELRFETRAVGIACDKGRITGVNVEKGNGSREELVADYYVLATQIEAAQPLITETMAEACGHCRELRQTRVGHVLGTMSGVQLYLRTEHRPFHGHFSLPFSPFGLTGIWQDEFWADAIKERWPDARSILSLIVTDWEGQVPGFGDRRGSELSRDEVRAAILAQVREGCQPLLPGEDPATVHNSPRLIDAKDLIADPIDDLVELGARGITANHGRLLIHPPGFWHRRVEAASAIENLFFAGDHVRTHIDLATMEGAVASASKVTNAILERIGSKAEPCPIHEVRFALESSYYRVRKDMDARLFRRGLRPLPLADNARDDRAELFRVPDTDDPQALREDFLAFERGQELALAAAAATGIDP